jgi:hypothetical protein
MAQKSPAKLDPLLSFGIQLYFIVLDRGELEQSRAEQYKLEQSRAEQYNAKH